MNTDDLARRVATGRIDDETLAHLGRLAEMGLSVAAVVHEARQPLAALRIALQLADERIAAGESPGEFLTDALAQSRRLEDFLERIRDHLQPGDGPTEVGVDALVASVLKLLGWQLERSRVSVDVRIEDGLPALRADRAQLEQVLQNLLHNARDALAERRGGGTIVVEATRGREEEVVILVGDNGGGIPRQLAQSIFEPFFSTKPRERGTGLGLYISRRIARRAGGDLELVGPDELGRVLDGDCATVFRLRLPVEATGAGARRALVVDDEEAIRRLLSKVVEAEGFECVTAADGERAIDLLDTEHFDLLVTDKNLPGASGIEVARFARAIRPDLPVLVITGFASEESALEAVALGIAAYVLKPVDLDDFRTRLRRAIGVPSLPPPPLRPSRPPSRPPARSASGPPSRPSDRPIGRLLDRPVSRPPGRSPSESPSHPPQPSRPPEERASLAAPGRFDHAEVGVEVLLVEPDPAVRGAIGRALTALGCEVAAFDDVARAEVRARDAGFEVLIAGPAVLTQSGRELIGAAGERALGAIAVMDRGGVDRSIEAIHLGARGMLSPPFEEDRITFEFRRAVGRLIEERGRAPERS